MGWSLNQKRWARSPVQSAISEIPAAFSVAKQKRMTMLQLRSSLVFFSFLHIKEKTYDYKEGIKVMQHLRTAHGFHILLVQQKKRKSLRLISFYNFMSTDIFIQSILDRRQSHEPNILFTVNQIAFRILI